MVIYFSTTGNTEYVAKQIAELIGDESLDLFRRIRDKDYSDLCSDRPYVVCAPSYVCDIPPFVAELLENTALTGCRQVYGVFTAGAYAGICGTHVRRIVRKKGMDFRGWKDLAMPNNYIASNLNAIPSEDEIRNLVSVADGQIAEIAYAIRDGRTLESRRVRLIEELSIGAVNPVWIRFMQPTSKFAADSRCTGCGACAARCPLNIIRMKDQKPEWTEKRCAHCMSCIQNCPAHAIEYGKITRDKPRYRLTKHLTKSDE